MNWLINKLLILWRESIVVHAILVVLTISIISGSIAFFTYWNHNAGLHNADSHKRDLLVSFATPIVLALPILFLWISRYVKLKKLSRELKVREKELADLIDIIPDIVGRSDPSRRLISVNKKYCEMMGHDRDYLIGRDFTELVHQESLESLELSLKQLTCEHPVHSNMELHIAPDGTECWVYWTNLMRFDLYGEPVEMLSIGKDITKLQNAQQEIEIQAKKLERANKLLEKANEELEQFTLMASHDLQEPLRKISFFSEVLADALEEKDNNTVKYALEVLSNAAGRSRAQVSNLLTLSRTSNLPLETTWIDLSELMDSVLSDLSLQIQQTQTKIVREDETLKIKGEWQLTSLILLNLIQNAIKFSHPERTPEVKISISRRGTNEYVLAIQDNGIGFENKYETEIFKVYQRLNSGGEYEGTGIGLAIVSTAVKRHGWRIHADSQCGQGATFFIEIPAESVKTNTDMDNQLAEAK